jgi:hypothetical protein
MMPRVWQMKKMERTRVNWAGTIGGSGTNNSLSSSSSFSSAFGGVVPYITDVEIFIQNDVASQSATTCKLSFKVPKNYH